MKLYTAGPMTGHPQFNFPAFDEASKSLRIEGFDIVSPAELDDPEDRTHAMSSPDGAPGTEGSHTWGDLLARDVKIIADEVDGVVLLPGWETSKGARLEAFICRLVGKPLFYNVTCSNPALHDRVCLGKEVLPEGTTCAEWHKAVSHLRPGDPDRMAVCIVGLDDAELDRVLTMADLYVLYKIRRDEEANGRD